MSSRVRRRLSLIASNHLPRGHLASISSTGLGCKVKINFSTKRARRSVAFSGGHSLDLESIASATSSLISGECSELTVTPNSFKISSSFIVLRPFEVHYEVDLRLGSSAC